MLPAHGCQRMRFVDAKRFPGQAGTSGRVRGKPRTPKAEAWARGVTLLKGPGGGGGGGVPDGDIEPGGLDINWPQLSRLALPEAERMQSQPPHNQR